MRYMYQLSFTQSELRILSKNFTQSTQRIQRLLSNNLYVSNSFGFVYFDFLSVLCEKHFHTKLTTNTKMTK
jgi:hypothetical protein